MHGSHWTANESSKQLRLGEDLTVFRSTYSSELYMELHIESVQKLQLVQNLLAT